MTPDPVHLYMVGCNHHHTPLEIRERLALSAEALRALRQSLQAYEGIRESLVLHTCNRVEVYYVSSQTVPRAILEQIVRFNGFDVSELEPYTYLKQDLEVVAHLYQVAAGLDSQMIGETEILGQVKSAYAEADQSGTLGPLLHRIFQKAFQASKWARTHTAISQGQTSIGNVAVDLAQRIFGRLTVSRTLIVGSGEVGRDVAKAFRSRGVACMSVASRTPERAEALAREVDGLIIPFNTWKTHLPYVDIAIFATASPMQIVNAAEVDAAVHKRPGRPLFLIDLAVPRDVDSSVADIEQVFLYNFGDLAKIANENLALRSAEVDHCRTELQHRATRLWQKVF